MLPILLPTNKKLEFPDVENALAEPNGLLAVGGDLSPQRILKAYQHGIFPWFSDDQPILWWSPDPRMVLYPDKLQISRSLKKAARKEALIITFDQAFTKVITACAQPRTKQKETWITAEMIQAYVNLHNLGHAHSFEAWKNGQLVGGLYGIAIGKVFFGESMFSLISNASKIAFIHAVQQLKTWDYQLVDCQVTSEHLQSFGAENIARYQFSAQLKILTQQAAATEAWIKENGTASL